LRQKSFKIFSFGFVTPKGQSVAVSRNGFSGVLAMSVSAVVPEKSCEIKSVMKRKKTQRRTTKFWPFWHRFKIAVTWLYATFLIPMCSFCRRQQANVNIWSIPLFLHFSGVAKNIFNN